MQKVSGKLYVDTKHHSQHVSSYILFVLLSKSCVLCSHINKRTQYENPVLKKKHIHAGKVTCIFYVVFLYIFVQCMQWIIS